ncbi:MAG TPA: cation transporter [Pirellulales bacterium]|jgi:copper chaperone CopZ|nr:cation transporter [Pirellulales bacterium]
MTRLLSVMTILVLGSVTTYAEENGLTKATYTIGGLHCPPCTRTVESSLGRVKGIKMAKVDWGTKSARISFDEKVVSPTQIAEAVSHTPHMMGGGMKYSGSLALSVPAVRDGESAKAAVDALKKLPGVGKVTTFPSTHTLTMQFNEGAQLSTSQILEALTNAGMPAKTY